MKDIFGNTKPVQIDTNEWWFNGRIIIKQDDYRLPTWVSDIDSKNSSDVKIHSSKANAIKYAKDNPFHTPDNQSNDYL